MIDEGCNDILWPFDVKRAEEKSIKTLLHKYRYGREKCTTIDVVRMCRS